MNRIICLSVVFLLSSVSIYAQIPTLTGVPDSIIVISTQAKIPDSVWVDIYVTSADSLTFFNIPLAWKTTCSAIYPVKCEYYYREADSEAIATIIYKTNQIWLHGPTGKAAFRVNRGWRSRLASLRFAIDEGANARFVVIDTSSDETLGLPYFQHWGDTARISPVFVRGEISLPGDTSRPLIFNAGQNYPNPFCANTSIKFTLKTDQMIKIQILSMTGKEVYSSESFYKAGQNFIYPDFSNTPSGVYYYRISNQDTTITRRMTLLK